MNTFCRPGGRGQLGMNFLAHHSRLRNKLQGHFNQNTTLFIPQDTFENVACKIGPFLCRSPNECVKLHLSLFFQRGRQWYSSHLIVSNNVVSIIPLVSFIDKGNCGFQLSTLRVCILYYFGVTTGIFNKLLSSTEIYCMLYITGGSSSPRAAFCDISILNWWR